MTTKVAPNYSFIPAASALKQTNTIFSSKFLEDVRMLESIINEHILQHCGEGSTHLITTLDFLVDDDTQYILDNKAMRDKAVEIILNDLIAAGYTVSEVLTNIGEGTIELDWRNIRNADRF